MTALVTAQLSAGLSAGLTARFPPPGPDRPRPGAPGHADPEPDPELAPWLAERLFAQRIVFLRGPLTRRSASSAAATLLSLDAEADGSTPEPVRLHLSAADGDMDAVFALIDMIDSLTTPVHAVATGEVGGAAVGVYAAARRRLAYPHARFRLAEPRVTDLTGTADDVAAAAGAHLRALEELVVRVATATGRPRSRVEDDFATGLVLDAVAARDYGLVHEIGGTTGQAGAGPA